MKRNNVLLIVMVLMMMLLSGCATRVKVGETGLKVNMYGSKKGVDDTVKFVTGRVWYNPITTEVHKVKTSVQRVIFTQDKREGSSQADGITFMSKGGLKVIGDFAVEYRVNEDTLRQFYIKYKSQIEDKGLDGFSRKIIRDRLRNIVNKKAESMQITEIIETGKKVIGDEAYSLLKDELLAEGILIEKVSIVNNWYLPDSVQTAISSKITATQKAEQAENELRQAKAEAKKKIAIAEGEAKANQIRQSSMTAKMIEYERMLNEREAIKKWNGTLPATMIPNTAVPFVGKVSK